VFPADVRSRTRQSIGSSAPYKGGKESTVKYIIDNQIILSRAPEGSVATYMEPFARSLREQGYARYSIHRQVLFAACFSEWLRQREVALRRITSDHPQHYLRRGCCRAPASARFSARRARDSHREKGLSAPTDLGRALCPGLGAALTGSAWLGQSHHHQLRSVHPQFSQGSFRRRARHSVAPVCP
jgi:hypothetical protein